MESQSEASYLSHETDCEKCLFYSLINKSRSPDNSEKDLADDFSASVNFNLREGE